MHVRRVHAHPRGTPAWCAVQARALGQGIHLLGELGIALGGFEAGAPPSVWQHVDAVLNVGMREHAGMLKEYAGKRKEHAGGHPHADQMGEHMHARARTLQEWGVRRDGADGSCAKAAGCGVGSVARAAGKGGGEGERDLHLQALDSQREGVPDVCRDPGQGGKGAHLRTWPPPPLPQHQQQQQHWLQPSPCCPHQAQPRIGQQESGSPGPALPCAATAPTTAPTAPPPPQQLAPSPKPLLSSPSCHTQPPHGSEPSRSQRSSSSSGRRAGAQPGTLSQAPATTPSATPSYLWLPVVPCKLSRFGLEQALAPALRFMSHHLAMGRRVLVHDDHGTRRQAGQNAGGTFQHAHVPGARTCTQKHMNTRAHNCTHSHMRTHKNIHTCVQTLYHECMHTAALRIMCTQMLCISFNKVCRAGLQPTSG